MINQEKVNENIHHISDNRDGHTLTVKELKEKYLSENINGKSQKGGN